MTERTPETEIRNMTIVFKDNQAPIKCKITLEEQKKLIDAFIRNEARFSCEVWWSNGQNDESRALLLNLNEVRSIC